MKSLTAGYIVLNNQTHSNTMSPNILLGTCLRTICPHYIVCGNVFNFGFRLWTFTHYALILHTVFLVVMDVVSVPDHWLYLCNH
ncbi:hypothetical protein FKM82_008531 [Ascaphus truei]